MMFYCTRSPKISMKKEFHFMIWQRVVASYLACVFPGWDAKILHGDGWVAPYIAVVEADGERSKCVTVYYLT